MVKAIYPGTFDPITNGHMDLIHRAKRLFKTLIVAVAQNPVKDPLFTISKRIELVENALTECNILNVSVIAFNKLLVHCAKEQNASVIVRGLRAVSDFEYELQMALINRKQNDNIETIFMMPDQDKIYLSSSVVKELAAFGGSLKCLVPQCVYRELKKEFHPCS